MRNIINISLPARTAKDIKASVKEEGFASVSEFIRHVIRFYNTSKLAREIKQDEKNMNWKELKSWDDLRK